jgi:hypothetical protein
MLRPDEAELTRARVTCTECAEEPNTAPFRADFASNSDHLLAASASFLLALSGREGFLGMTSVDMIGNVPLAYFQQRLPIKEIVRTLSVSRATVRKVVRSHKTEIKYERGVQPRAEAWCVGRYS